MVLIAISGAHGTGKSTLISAVDGDDVHVAGNVMKGLRADGYPVGVDVTPRTIEEYVLRQNASELNGSKRPIVISDRTLLDGLAYVLTNMSFNMGYRWSGEELVGLRQATAVHVARFDIYGFTPIEFPLSESHPMRALGEDYRSAVEQNLCVEAIGMGLDLIPMSGTVQERMYVLDEVINSAHSANTSRPGQD